MGDADEQTRDAIAIVAQSVAAEALARRHDLYDQWEDYPEIGEFDWDMVQEAVDRHATALQPQQAMFDAAYEHLSHRAK